MVGNVSEHEMREALAQNKESLPSQKGKATTRSRLRWVFRMIQDIHTLNMANMPAHVSGLNKAKEKVVRLFGGSACAINGVTC